MTQELPRLFARRLLSLFRRSRLDQDLDQELASHLEFAVEESIRSGMSPQEARRQAMLKLGGLERAKELHRETRALPQLDSFLQDLRYAFRTLRRDAGFTTVALLILALGIGANIAVFSVVNTVLLRPLPFSDAQQLVWIEDDFSLGAGQEVPKGLSSTTFPVDVFEAMRSGNHSFEDITAYNGFFAQGDYKLLGRGEPERLVGLPVAENFFSVLGLQPAVGRWFLKEECQKNGRKAVILSHSLWQNRFAANPGIIGQSVTLNKDSVTVVGVLPSTFDFASIFSPGTQIDIYVPGIMDEMRNDGNELSLIGRLKPGVSLETARAEFQASAANFRRSHPDWYAAITPKLAGLQDYVSGRLRRSLQVVWCAVGLILLIVCADLANLLLARSTSRSKEFAVRTALGAGRFRIIRQLMTEGLLLSGAGAVLGLGLAFAITRYLATRQTIALPLLSSVRVDLSALAFTALLAIGSAVLFGLAPSLQVAVKESSLRESVRGASESKRHVDFRSTLVVSQIALACVLLAGAGLLLRSFLHLLDVDMGFQPSHASTLRIAYDPSASQARTNAFFQELLRQVVAIPGVEAAGITDALPMEMQRSWGVLAQGRVWPRDMEIVFVNIVAPGYLDAMGMRLQAGRGFNWSDAPKNEPVIVINEALARRGWPGQNALGKFVQMSAKESRRIVGIVANVRESSLEEQGRAAIFLPLTQTLDLAGSSKDVAGIAQLVIRTTMPVGVITSAVKTTLRSLNPNQPVKDFQTLDHLVSRSASPRRFFMLMVAAFALLGVIFAALGIYGVISYTVVRQRQEIGIRMALGASAQQVRSSVLGKTVRMALAGIAVGSLAAFASTQLMSALLFRVSPKDPPTFAATAILLLTVACAAGYIPARRASRVDPMVALRSE